MVVQFVLPTVVGISAVLLYGIGKLLLKKFSLLPVICLFIVNPAFIYFYLTGIDQSGLFWASSRVVPYTITEYPLFAILFGDVHAHTMGIFNQILFILLIVYLLTHWQKLNNSGRVVCAIVAGISLGTMLGMNVWDALSYAPIFILAAIVIWYQTHRGVDGEESFRTHTSVSKACVHLYHDVSSLLKKRTEISNSSATILYLWILVPLIALLSYAPFFLMMNGGDQGVGIVHTKTTIPEFFLVFGWFLVLLICTLYSDIKKQPNLLLVAIPFLLVGYPLIGFIIVLLAYLIVRRGGVPDFLLASGLLLALLCELIYVMNLSDVGEWYRQNTVFKLYFSAWFLLGIGSLCSVSIRVEQLMDRLLHGGKGAIIEKYLPKLVVCGVVILVLSVPILNQQLRFVSYDEIQGLDGYGWMKITHPGDYAAAMYLRELSGEYVLVEAELQPHFYYGRISSATGIPTILGWAIYYESTWRGDNPPGWEYERKTDISMIYEQPERASEIMAKYNANLLILGALERERYQIPDDLSAYQPDLVPVFTAGETVIYQRVEE
jgi:YYY domain-containing protein